MIHDDEHRLREYIGRPSHVPRQVTHEITTHRKRMKLMKAGNDINNNSPPTVAFGEFPYCGIHREYYGRTQRAGLNVKHYKDTPPVIGK